MAEQQKKVQEDVNQLRKVRREKLADLQSNGKNPFEITRYDVTCHTADIKEHYDEMEGKQVSLAGRVMQKRVMGKASFCNILDQSGDIQSYVARDWTSTQHSSWKDELLKNSIMPIQQFSYTQGKNATDSAMIIDAMDK